MDGWMDGWMDGRTEGWIGGWMSIRLKQSQRKNNAYSSLFSENLKILKILTSEISHIQYVLHTDNYCSHILTYYDCNIIIFTKLQEKFSVLFNSCSINNSKAPSPKPITPPENYRFWHFLKKIWVELGWPGFYTECCCQAIAKLFQVCFFSLELESSIKIGKVLVPYHNMEKTWVTKFW